ncbi:MAG: transcription termination/antitermination NusG family protein [Leptolyngbya sp.]|nr:transcription termination/antitermination NusG family protein [Leptolyngbya sp.]
MTFVARLLASSAIEIDPKIEERIAARAAVLWAETGLSAGYIERQMRFAVGACERFWVVARVRPGHELQTGEALKAFGFDHWAPVETLRFPPRRGMKARMITRPLFCGYVFVRAGLDPRALSGLAVIAGIAGYLSGKGDGAGVAVLPEKLMKELQIKALAVRDRDVKPAFKAGQSVQINDGHLAGFVGTVRRIYGRKGRADVVINCFGGETRTNLALDALTKSD